MGGHWSNNINEDIYLFKVVKVSDMPFRARQFTRVWPHTRTTHGGAPWQCEIVPSQWTRVSLPSLSNRFGLGGHEHGSMGFLSGAPGELNVHPLCEGMGKGFSLAHALEAKRGWTWNSPCISLQAPNVYPRGATWRCSWVGQVGRVWTANYLGNVLEVLGPLVGLGSSN
jgi:hypothetical protein